MSRELGASPTTCPNCGTTLEQAAQPDGSVASGPCPTCYPAEVAQAPAPEQAAQAPVVPQAPAVSREQGTAPQPEAQAPVVTPPAEQGVAPVAPATTPSGDQA